jgi:tetratricopeptide (TPR) repeat protein
MSRASKVVFFVVWFCCPVGLFAQKPPLAQSREIREHFALAQQAMEQKQLDSAYREFNAILTLDPKNIEARGDLGVVQFLQGKYAEASQNLHAALRSQPSLWKAQAILGLCDKAMGRLDSAKTLLEKSYPHLTQDPRLQLNAGLALVEIDYQRLDMEKALEVLSRLRNANPSNVDVLYVTYRIHSDLAVQARDSLALVAPDSARMHQLLAEHLVTEGKIEDAITQYRDALRIAPRLPGVHFELGEAILAASSSEEARGQAQQEFETALAIDPGDAKAECRLGALANLRGDTATALQHYSRAAETDPESAEAQIGLGGVLLSTEELDKATEHLLRAVRIDPLNAIAHFRLSQAYRQLGRASDADNEVAKFKELRAAEDRLQAAYGQVNLRSGTDKVLHPDVPQ